MRKETTKTWLELVKRALLEEGFKPTRFQRIKPGQSFGLVKDLDGPWQMHIRGFQDGCLESEIEISRFYQEHARTSRPAVKELREILQKHRIPYRRETRLAAPIGIRGRAPPMLTDWRRTLIHPILYKVVGVYSLSLGILTFVLCAHFWDAIKSALLLPLFFVLTGLHLLALGVGILSITFAVERALKRE